MRTRIFHRPYRAVTILELVMVMVLISGLTLSSLYAMQTSRRAVQRNKVMTALSLRANSDLERLRAESAATLKEGTRDLLDAALPEAKGQVQIKPAQGLDLKEITVRWEQESPSGPCKVVLATVVKAEKGKSEE